eukprot:scaffold101951_cov69-Phaeocystis_antarctica.AAC.2
MSGWRGSKRCAAGVRACVLACVLARAARQRARVVRIGGRAALTSARRCCKNRVDLVKKRYYTNHEGVLGKTLARRAGEFSFYKRTRVSRSAAVAPRAAAAASRNHITAGRSTGCSPTIRGRSPAHWRASDSWAETSRPYACASQG